MVEHISYTNAPEEHDSESGDDREEELQRGADPNEVRKRVPTGPVDEEIRLVADGRHERRRGGKRDRQNERERVRTDRLGGADSHRNHQHNARVVTDDARQQSGREVEHPEDTDRGQERRSRGDSIAQQRCRSSLLERKAEGRG